MQQVLAKYAILLVSINVVISQFSAVCPLYTWQCNNAQCIKLENLCDGSYDCVDKSDETVEVCLLRPCPSYAFQCTYGACITGNFKCDGIVNCVDGSDENKYLCQPKLNYERELQGKCGFPNSMECKSGECINNEKLCDGTIDCLDGSDETVEVCSSLKCPEYSFRCGYGACVTGLSACDGIKNCRDGSDEISSICSNITNIEAATVKPVPQDTTSTTIKPYITPTSTTNIYPGSSEIPSSSSSSSHIHCSTMILSRGISSVAACFYQNHPVSCHEEENLLPGTIANATCAVGYIEKQNKENPSTMKCDTDGEWTRLKDKCIPDCGTMTDAQKDSNTKPWEVTILRRDYAPIYMPICSGVIVSPKIVLTAANCFLSYNNAYYTDHVFYNLIEGFHNESYINGIHTSAKVHNISNIIIKNVNRAEDLAVLMVVNYFQFSRNLKPICLPTAQSNVFPFHNDSKLNIGRPIIRDNNRVYLEYLIAGIENMPNGRKTLTYVNIYNYIPFINKEVRKYNYLL